MGRQVKVDRCIYKDKSSGLFYVTKCVDSKVSKSTFDDIDLAISFRDSIKKSPKCKVCSKTIKSGNYCSDHIAESEANPMYDVFARRLTIDEMPERYEKDVDILTVVCHKCKKRIIPKRAEVSQRIACLNSRKDSKGAKGFIYCSDECKYSCSDFGFEVTDKTNSTERCNHYLNKKSLLQLQIDEVGYYYCEKCGLDCNPELHHGLQISIHVNESSNVAHQILVCEKCHKEFKGKGGC